MSAYPHIPFGAFVRDRVTGFAGCLTAKMTSIDGGPRYLVEPEAKPGAPFVAGEWFDAGRIIELPGATPQATDGAAETTTAQADATPAAKPSFIEKWIEASRAYQEALAKAKGTAHPFGTPVLEEAEPAPARPIRPGDRVRSSGLPGTAGRVITIFDGSAFIVQDDGWKVIRNLTDCHHY